MNNNRGNNRRRGRGNNRPQGGGGGQQLNRIDSRARGNAPQLLEKYRKLAQDAHLNGDRVTAEYYLQFADHYFRVIADTRSRQEEQRARRDDRWQDQPEDGEDSGEFTVDSDFPAFEQPVYTRREREDREPREPREGREGREPREARERNGRERDQRDAPRRAPRGADAEPAPEAVEAAEGQAEGADEATRSVYEPAENPFVRGNRGLRPRREDRRPRRTEAEGEAEGGNGRDGEPPAMLDAALLPPALASREEAPAEVDGEAPAPKRRGRKPKAAVAAEGEA